MANWCYGAGQSPLLNDFPATRELPVWNPTMRRTENILTFYITAQATGLLLGLSSSRGSWLTTSKASGLSHQVTFKQLQWLSLQERSCKVPEMHMVLWILSRAFVQKVCNHLKLLTACSLLEPTWTTGGNMKDWRDSNNIAWYITASSRLTWKKPLTNIVPNLAYLSLVGTLEWIQAFLHCSGINMAICEYQKAAVNA